MDGSKSSSRDVLIAGACSLLAGGFIMLVAFGGVFTDARHAPAWVLAAAGAAFVLAGLVLAIQAIGGASGATGELPAAAPRWMAAAQWLLGLSVWALLGTVGAWVAFAPGPRSFSMSVGGGAGPSPEIVGRITFGIGAVLTWLGFAAVVATRLRRRRSPWPNKVGTRAG